METPQISKRGVYYDLTVSPYVYKMTLGGILQFSSKKKLEIYTRELAIRKKLIKKTFEKVGVILNTPMLVTEKTVSQIELTLYREVEY